LINFTNSFKNDDSRNIKIKKEEKIEEKIKRKKYFGEKENIELERIN
jgi:hypothetical protein